MFQSNVVQSLLKGLDPLHQKSISLVPGQIFNGKIQKIYPGQLASLQLGGLMLTAKLEAALAQGNRYWFQVQPGEGLPVLKVLEGSSHNGDGNPLRQLGLPNTKSNEFLVNYFAKEEVPFLKKHVNEGAKTLQKVGMFNERGLSILQLLIQRKLPITATTFLAVQSVVENQNSLYDQLRQLSDELKSHNLKQPVTLQLQTAIEKILSSSTIKIDHHQVLDTIKHFFTEDPRSLKFMSAQNQLEKLGLIQNYSTPPQQEAAFKERLSQTSDEQLKYFWPTLTKEELIAKVSKGEWTDVLNKLVLQSSGKSDQTVQQLLNIFFKKTGKDSSGFEGNEALSKQITSILKQVGFQYERDVSQLLHRQGASSEQLLSQLKSLLIQSQQLELPGLLHEKIDSLLYRVTGQQLFSQNQDGPLTNHIVMVPLRFLGMETDLTIQWEGKKQSNEQLDPNYCRILLYIHLNHLKETIIDVNIQNRIVSLHIINDHEKPLKFIELFQPYLKESLHEHNYQLTSIKWTQPQHEATNKTPIRKQIGQHSTDLYQTQRPYQGVDIRI